MTKNKIKRLSRTFLNSLPVTILSFDKHINKIYRFAKCNSLKAYFD